MADDVTTEDLDREGDTANSGPSRRALRDPMQLLEVRVEAGLQAEILAAEAWSAGAAGIEERDLSDELVLLLIYATTATIDAVKVAIGCVPAVITGPHEVDDRDWVEEWRKGLTAVEIGDRLVVRPSFIEYSLKPSQIELIIDPGQAFGTGGHATTTLALEMIVAAGCAASAFGASTRVLDVGTGTGVLALAALAFGAGRALGFDLDKEAGRAARMAAECNGLASRLDVLTGPIDAIDADADPAFDWVFANLLKREMLPIAGRIAAVTRRGGRAIFSGLLSTERAQVERALEDVGFTGLESRTQADPSGGEWMSLLMLRS